MDNFFIFKSHKIKYKILVYVCQAIITYALFIPTTTFAQLSGQTAYWDGDQWLPWDKTIAVSGGSLIVNESTAVTNDSVANSSAWFHYHEDSSSALTDAVVKPAQGGSLRTYITYISVSTGAATALNFFLEEGSTKVYGPKYLEAVAGRNYVHGNGRDVIYKSTANTAVTITTSAAIAHSIDIKGFIAP